mgnify:CR=1 FL=1
MHLPVITYSAKISSDLTYKDGQEIFGGTYTKNTPISVDVRIWNNKFGEAVVDDLKNFCINLYFADYEDSVLLKYLKVVHNNIQELPVEVKNNVATVSFFNSEVLKGTTNDGSDTDTDNYLDLKITFDASGDDIQLKVQDIKSLIVEITAQ